MGWLSLHAQPEWRRDSVWNDRGVPITSEFEPNTRIYIPAYAGNGQPSEVAFTRLNAFGEWENRRRRTMDYDGDNLSRLLVERWDANGQQWVGQTRRLFTYNNQGRLTQRLVQMADMPGAPLENSARWGYTYLPNGNEEQIIYQQWQNGDWRNKRRQLFSYNADGELETQTLELWNEDNSSWEGAFRRQWSYAPNGFNISELTTQRWENNNSSWGNVSRRQFFYNNAGFWQGTVFQEWDAGAGVWQNQSRELHQLNAQNNMDNLLFQLWNGAEWESRVRETTRMNNRSLSTVIEQRDLASGEWERVTRYGTLFSPDGRVLEDIRNQVWEDNAQEWLNDSTTIRYTHYWSEVMVSAEEREAGAALCKVPNPYQPGMPISCASGMPGQPLDVRLYDLLGRQLYQAQTHSPEQFSIDMALPSGTYLLQLSQGARARQAQLLIVSH